MSDKPKRTRCPNGLRKNKKTGLCEIKDKNPTIDTINKVANKKFDPKKKLKPIPKKKVIKIKKKVEPKPQKKIKIIKDKPKPAPLKGENTRSKIRNPVKEISERIKRLGSDFFRTFPKQTIKFIDNNLFKIMDSDIPFNIITLRNRFQKEVKESIQNLRKLKRGLGKVVKAVGSKEEMKLEEYKIQFALLKAINSLLETFDNSNQFVRDKQFNYFIDAKKLDENKIKKTVKYLNALKDVDDFETNKRYFGKPTDQQKAKNKENMKILKEGLKTDLYGVKSASIFLTLDPKSKTWNDAYDKLFKVKNKFKLNISLIDQPYKKALKNMKIKLNVLYGKEYFDDEVEQVEDDDLS